MTTSGTVALLGVAGALVVLVWVGGTDIVPHRQPSAPAGPPLLDAPVASVGRIEWTRGPDRLTLVRTPAGWVDAAGHSWPRDTIDTALDTLASLRPHVVVPAGEAPDLAEYGLDGVAERLRVLDGTGRELLAMDIGNRNPAWTGVFARRAGRGDVLLVGALLRWELDKLRSAREAQDAP